MINVVVHAQGCLDESGGRIELVRTAVREVTIQRVEIGQGIGDVAARLRRESQTRGAGQLGPTRDDGTYRLTPTCRPCMMYFDAKASKISGTDAVMKRPADTSGWSVKKRSPMLASCGVSRRIPSS